MAKKFANLKTSCKFVNIIVLLAKYSHFQTYSENAYPRAFFYSLIYEKENNNFSRWWIFLLKDTEVLLEPMSLDPIRTMNDLWTMCIKHLEQTKSEKYDLYRIFYYDCLPYDKNNTILLLEKL